MIVLQHCVIKIIAWSLNSEYSVKILNHSEYKNRAKAMFMLINNLKKSCSIDEQFIDIGL